MGRAANWLSVFRGSVALADFGGTRKFMTTDEVLARYPGPVTLYASKFDTTGTPLLFALFCASLFFFDVKGGKEVAIGVGGVFLVYAIVNYLRETTLELTAWGFATKDFGSAKTKCAWRAASEFKVKMGRGVAIQYVDDNYDQTFLGPQRSVPGVYPFNALALAALMNAWRERSLGIGPGQE